MKTFLKIFVLLVGLNLLISNSVSSMSILDNTQMYSLSIKDGLIDNKVNCLLQDKKGFVWIGTDRGVCKYDGYEFTTIKLDTINNNLYIYDVYEDSDNRIWIATQMGLFVYDNIHCQVSKVNIIDFPVKRIRFSEKEELMIVGTNKIVSYSPQKNNLKTIFSDSLISMYDILSYDNQLWIGTKDGLYKKDKNGIKKDSILSDDVVKMLHDSQGNIWMASYRSGITRYNTRNKKIYRYLEKSSKHHALHVNAIIEFKPGILLIGCDNGLIGLDYVNNESQIIAKDKLDDRFIYSFLKDDNDGLWIGTYNNGLNYFCTNKSLFARLEGYKGGNTLSQIVEDNENNLWIATEDSGVYKYTKGLNIKLGDRCRKIALTFYNSHAMMVLGNELWVGLYMQGIDVIDINKGNKIKNICLNSDIYKNSVYSLFHDSSGNIWAGTLSGLFLKENCESDFSPVINDVLPQDCRIFTIQQDKDGVLWFGTLENGLYSYDIKSGEWNKCVSLGDININTLYCYNEYVYIGTHNSGIIIFDRLKKEFHYLEDTDGMSIYHIIGYNDKIWFSTFNSICVYDIKNKNVSQYDINDGLEVVPFSINSGTLTSNGRILFGGTKGIEIFKPEELSESVNVRNIRLTQLKIFYSKIYPGPDAPINKSISFTDKIFLDHDQRTFSISFSSMDFFNEKKNKYEYMLKGFDNDWIPANNVNEAKYTNVPPGKYQFVVRNKINNLNENNLNGTSVMIYVDSHPLLSNVAICVYVILFFCIVYLYISYYKHSLKTQQKKILELNKYNHEKEVFEAKMNFFTNVTHEIKTPLSLISGPVESLLSNNSLTDDIKEELHIIQRNSEKLQNLVSELLDFKKIESESYSIKKESCNIQTIVDDVIYRYKSICKLKNISLLVDYNSKEEKLHNCFTDIDAASKIINNIISNAVKYTTNKVDVVCVEDNQFILLSVSDNGAGISETDYENIFKPFVRLNSTPKFSTGTGLGLALVRSLCLLLDWKIEVKSEINIGTTITLYIPYIHNRQDISNDLDSEMAVINNELYTILLIDDNIDILSHLSKQLRNNFNVLTCADSSYAVDLIKSTRVDIIVSDLMMPKMNGIELCKIIKNNIATSHIPFIMLTASENFDYKLDSFDNGVDAYVEKPVNIQIFIAQINSILTNRKLNVERFCNEPAVFNNIPDENSTDHKFLSVLNKYINENISNTEIDIESMCEEFAIGRTTMFNKIKSLCGVTPKEYVRIIRLKKAAEMLRTGDYRINEVGFLVGFNTPSYFSKCFMKQFGVLPGDYVKLHKESKESKF